MSRRPPGRPRPPTPVGPPVSWYCQHCTRTQTTRNPDVANVLHPCTMTGLDTPMLREGSGSRLILVERADYIGDETVTFDINRRPIMSAITERPDGSNDVAVYAPTARLGVHS